MKTYLIPDIESMRDDGHSIAYIAKRLRMSESEVKKLLNYPINPVDNNPEYQYPEDL